MSNQGALFYPTKSEDGRDINFDSLYIPAIFHEIYYDGLYIDILNVLDKTKKDPIIVDVGANLGITVDHFRKHAKKVYAIEPSTEHFNALKKNKEFNNWDNVEIFKCAISDKDGEADLRLYNENRTSHSIVFPSKPGEAVEKVPTKTFMTFFKENNITHVDFMKFDVEGAENLILPSKDFAEASKIIDNIEVEFHFQDYPNLVNTMIKLGYTARRYDCAAIVINFSR